MIKDPVIKPVKERSNLDLFNLVCELSGRFAMHQTEALHTAYVEAKTEMESRLSSSSLPEGEAKLHGEWIEQIEQVLDVRETNVELAHRQQLIQKLYSYYKQAIKDVNKLGDTVSEAYSSMSDEYWKERCLSLERVLEISQECGYGNLSVHGVKTDEWEQWYKKYHKLKASQPSSINPSPYIQGKLATGTEIQDDFYPGKRYQNLFNYVANELNISLLQSDMDEIISIVHRDFPSSINPSTEGVSELLPTIEEVLSKYDFIEFENGKYYHRSVVINAMAEYSPKANCEHCGDPIEHSICRSCEIEITLPDNEY